MTEFFVDTNVFLRFLIPDEKNQHQISKNLFRLAETGTVKLWTTDVVILEIVWTLTSVYRAKKNNVYQSVSSILALKGLKVTNSGLLIKALKDWLEKNVDFADAYNFQLARVENKPILSFDRDFNRLGAELKKSWDCALKPPPPGRQTAS